MAEDDTGATAVDERLVVGVENLPPIVRMEARPGQAPGTMVLSAEASDDDGQIREVEFFLADSEQFDAKLVSVGRAECGAVRSHRASAAVRASHGDCARYR
jgi:hypothetical protein